MAVGEIYDAPCEVDNEQQKAVKLGIQGKVTDCKFKSDGYNWALTDGDEPEALEIKKMKEVLRLAQEMNELQFADHPKESCAGDISKESCAEDISKELCSGDIPKESCAGDISKESCAGNIPKESCAGDISKESCAGDISKESCAGDISKESCAGDISKESCAGDISKELCAGDISKKSCAGDISKELCAGDKPNESCAEENQNKSNAEENPNESCAGDKPNESCDYPSDSDDRDNLKPSCNGLRGKIGMQMHPGLAWLYTAWILIVALGGILIIAAGGDAILVECQDDCTVPHGSTAEFHFFTNLTTKSVDIYRTCPGCTEEKVSIAGDVYGSRFDLYEVRETNSGEGVLSVKNANESCSYTFVDNYGYGDEARKELKIYHPPTTDQPSTNQSDSSLTTDSNVYYSTTLLPPDMKSKTDGTLIIVTIISVCAAVVAVACLAIALIRWKKCGQKKERSEPVLVSLHNIENGRAAIRCLEDDARQLL